MDIGTACPDGLHGKPAGTERGGEERPACGHALLPQPRSRSKALRTVHAGSRISLQPVPRRPRQAMEALVHPTGAALLDVPALRRALLRDKPTIRSIQRGEHEAAPGTFQGGTLLEVRRGVYGSGAVVRLSFYTLPTLGAGDEHRGGIPAYRIRAVPLLPLRGEDRKREQEFHCAHKGGHIAGVCDKMTRW